MAPRHRWMRHHGGCLVEVRKRLARIQSPVFWVGALVSGVSRLRARAGFFSVVVLRKSGGQDEVSVLVPPEQVFPVK